MAITVEQAYDPADLEHDGSAFTSGTIYYIVNGVSSENAAIKEVLNVLPTGSIGEGEETETGIVYEGMQLSSISIDDRLAEESWKVAVNYSFDADTTSGGSGGGGSGEKPEPAFAFEIGTQTKHLTHSIETVRKYPDTAKDFKNAINYDPKKRTVQGVDIISPVSSFSETQIMSNGEITNAYKRTVQKLVGKVNKDEFRGYQPGEVLFLGCYGSRNGKSSSDKWTVTFKFNVSFNEKRDMNGFTDVEKDGWDLAWTYFEEDVSEDQTFMIRNPKAIYIERVYPRESFKGLGI